MSPSRLAGAGALTVSASAGAVAAVAMLGVCCGPAEMSVGPSATVSCYECHVDFKEEPLTAVHRRHGVGCVRCHGPSPAHMRDEDRKTRADVTFRTRKRQEVFCLACHGRAKHLKRREHRANLARGPKALRCTGCHGDHKVVETTAGG
jgi:hypothetical protein